MAVAYMDKNEAVITFQKPGALQKARWMAKLIYSLKLALLETNISELPRGAIPTKDQFIKLRDFVSFICLVYCKC